MLLPTSIFSGLDDVEIIASVFLALIILSLILRLYVRLNVPQQFDVADGAMVFTFIVMTSQCVVSIVSGRFARNYFATGDIASALVNRKMTKASNGMYCLILAGLKVSLGAFFLKIFSHKKMQKAIIYLVVGLTIACAIVYFCFATVTCAQLKIPPIERGRCEWQDAYNIIFYIFSVLNIAGDFILTTMGIAALWMAKLPVYTKIPACILLSMGCMSAIAAMSRLILLLQPSEQRTFTEQSLALGQWTLVEQGSGVVAANLLMLRPLLSANLLMLRPLLSACMKIQVLDESMIPSFPYYIASIIPMPMTKATSKPPSIEAEIPWA
ncbi:hypothetical protein KVT40_004670 [Elsinoe batatas]|uniref:Rhodopsin domain-containing protein n=1 Tax=Elsinoe batatas TaxID=2601811 RepID=A0A8K0L157_9PEZI|nr:hypothetical protein KVT40_004670 [Elsinoe batatas]